MTDMEKAVLHFLQVLKDDGIVVLRGLQTVEGSSGESALDALVSELHGVPGATGVLRDTPYWPNAELRVAWPEESR